MLNFIQQLSRRFTEIARQSGQPGRRLLGLPRLQLLDVGADVGRGSFENGRSRRRSQDGVRAHPKGTFLLGSPADEKERNGTKNFDAEKQHEVVIHRPRHVPAFG